MLKQLMLSKQIEQRKNALNELVQQEDAFKVRSEKLEAAIEEAQTDEEITAVTEEVRSWRPSKPNSKRRRPNSRRRLLNSKAS